MLQFIAFTMCSGCAARLPNTLVSEKYNYLGSIYLLINIGITSDS